MSKWFLGGVMCLWAVGHCLAGGKTYDGKDLSGTNLFQEVDQSLTTVKDVADFGDASKKWAMFVVPLNEYTLTTNKWTGYFLAGTRQGAYTNEFFEVDSDWEIFYHGDGLMREYVVSNPDVMIAGGKDNKVYWLINGTGDYLSKHNTSPNSVILVLQLKDSKGNVLDIDGEDWQFSYVRKSRDGSSFEGAWGATVESKSDAMWHPIMPVKYLSKMPNWWNNYTP